MFLFSFFVNLNEMIIPLKAAFLVSCRMVGETGEARVSRKDAHSFLITLLKGGSLTSDVLKRHLVTDFGVKSVPYKSHQHAH